MTNSTPVPARVPYSTTGTLRTELPTLETPFGVLAYRQSLQFGQYGRISLGAFDGVYTGKGERPYTVNGVDYKGDIEVYVSRDGELALSFRDVRRVNDSSSQSTPAADRKLGEYLLPIARELFPLPTEENMHEMIFQEMRRELKSRVSSALHTVSTDVYFDTRYAGYEQDVKDGWIAGLQEATAEALTKQVSVTQR